MVTKQIEQLKQLQDILVRRLAIEQQLKDIPKNLVIKRDLLDRIRDRYKGNSEAKEKKQQELSRLRVELEQNERDREKTEGQIEHVNTQREYEALEKEIRERSDRESVIREHQEILKNEISQLEESLEQELELTKTQEEELTKEEREMNTQSQKLHKDMERLEVDELRLGKDFSAEFLFKFRRIISTIGGRGIVSLTSTVCSGCHMILPNHIVNEVHREQEIFFCPYCSKVLYYSAPIATEGEERVERVTDADLVEEFEGPLGDDINFDDLFAGKELENDYSSNTSDDIETELDDDDEEEEDDDHIIRENDSDDDYDDSHYEDGGDDDSSDSVDDAASESYVEYDSEDENFPLRKRREIEKVEGSRYRFYRCE